MPRTRWKAPVGIYRWATTDKMLSRVSGAMPLGFDLPGLPCTIQPKSTAGIDMERLNLLKRITFGERVAEDETAALGKYFVETDQWDRIFNGDIDVIRGDKGSGKSAIYSLLVAKSDELFDKRVLLTTAERPRGATVFNDLVSDPPTSEQEFVGLWKLYIVTIIAQKIREFGVSGTEFEKLISTLEGQGLLEIDSDLARVFKSVRRY